MASVVKIETDVAEEPPVFWKTKEGKQESKQDQPEDDNLTFSGIKTGDAKSSGLKNERKSIKNKKPAKKHMKPAHMMNKVRKSCASYQSDKNDADIQQPWPSTVISAKPAALDRPHVCPHCSAAFIQSCSLRIHMASTHGGNLKAVHRDSSIPDGGVGSCGERTEQRAAVPVHDNLSLNLCAVLCSWLLTEGVPAGHDPTSSDKETSDTEWSDSSHEGCENKSKKALKKHSKAPPPSCGSSVGHQPISDNPDDQKSALSAFIPAAPSSLVRPHVCQHCSAAFVQFSSLKIHMASSHRGKLQASRPEPSRLNTGDSNYGDRADVKKKVEARQKVCDDRAGEVKVKVRQKIFDKRTGEVKVKARQKMFDNRAGEVKVKAMQKVCDDRVGEVKVKARQKMCDDRAGEVKVKARGKVCDVCGKTFSLAANLKRHKRIHAGHKPFMCSQCGRAFTRADHLEYHKRIHTGQKPFVCDVCCKSFDEPDSLAKHKRIHTDRKSVHYKAYACDACSKTFTQSGSLTVHKRIHTGHKPFECDVCHEAFARSDHLARHKRIHTGHKSFNSVKL